MPGAHLMSWESQVTSVPDWTGEVRVITPQLWDTPSGTARPRLGAWNLKAPAPPFCPPSSPKLLGLWLVWCIYSKPNFPLCPFA